MSISTTRCDPLSMKRFGVIGHPARHSLSPLLHGEAYRHLRLDCSYEAFDVLPEKLTAAVQEFRKNGFAGLNVTLPHKEAVMRLVDFMTDEARSVGAVNTMMFTEDGIGGENTDVHGFAASVEHVRQAIDGHLVLLLGAGGSSRAVFYPLLSRFRPSEVIVANRSLSRARELVEHLRGAAGTTQRGACSLDPREFDAAMRRANLIVNCTSAGLFPAVDECPVHSGTVFRPDQIVMDLIYTPLQTKLLHLAARSGARTISGLEMFIHQGARSFQIWLGQEMPIETVRPLILNALQSQQH